MGLNLVNFVFGSFDHFLAHHAQHLHARFGSLRPQSRIFSRLTRGSHSFNFALANQANELLDGAPEQPVE
jgi:hypothetical protein